MAPVPPPDSPLSFEEPSDQDEWQLIEESSSEDESDEERLRRMSNHDLKTAPIFTREALALLSSKSKISAQYGVLGKTIGIYDTDKVYAPADPRLYINTNAPFSAIICGVQGSGKSHTLGAILESMLIPRFSPIGQLNKPLCGLVLHYGEGGQGALPNEAAWLCYSQSSLVTGPPVKVYVSHSSLNTMRKVYAPLGDKVVVEPLYFKRKELDAHAVLSMMAIGSSESAPLYMQIILSILRDLGENYDFKTFTKQLDKQKEKFNPAQVSGLEQRMSLLTSFLEPTSANGKTSSSQSSRFAAGQLTIVDLSDPFLDEGAACGLFDIIIRLFVRAEVNTGKVLVVDEAHKYLSPNRSASGLTKTLLRLIRQQRHLAMRVLISTQEPTVVPKTVLDLCSVTILHRFTSPSWWAHLIQHVSADFSKSDAFDQVVKLQTGQALIMAPSGLGVFSDVREVPSTGTSGASKKVPSSKTVGHIGRRYVIMKTRRRVTADGGASILAVS
ncbi:hypothetical protein DFP72DRAFT_878655 [Ephemerocybe angulata]|uniref:Zona occludens toxin N-terminal domain-containing protein n=1 Tax=Ephemerocybe angulata TaxID=980116 RepID=A0A8H6ME04_9AGAR|nr:hypothetical protein DFP72DRAFT_878655 [Tulosesus angulatus]